MCLYLQFFFLLRCYFGISSDFVSLSQLKSTETDTAEFNVAGFSTNLLIILKK